MVTFNRNTIFKAVFDALKDDSTITASATVTAAYHDDDPASFPQVVVSPVDVPRISENFFASSFSQHPIVVVVDVFALDTKTLDELSDLVVKRMALINFGSSLSLQDVNESYAYNNVLIGRESVKRNLHNRVLSFSLLGYGDWLS